MRSILRHRAGRDSGTIVLGACAVLILLGMISVRPVGAQMRPLVIRSLAFKGNKSIESTVLAAAIATTNSAAFARWPILRKLGLGEKRLFDQRQFQSDVLRLGVLYKASGFPDVVIDTVVERAMDNVKVTFRITEGEPVRISRLHVTGLDSVPEFSKFVRNLPAVEGDPFSRYKLFESADTLGLRLMNNGYPTATVDVVYGEADSGQRVRSATLQVDPGHAAVYGDVRVVGMERVDSGFIASLVTALPGRPYRYGNIFRSQRSLYGSELFRFATVGIDTARFTLGDSIVPILVTVSEGRFHRALGSVGYGTNDCIRAGAGYTVRNFLGGGRIVDVTGRLSKIGVGSPLGLGLERSICSPLAQDSVGSSLLNYGLNASLRRNGFLSASNSAVLALFTERRSEYNVYLRDEVGVSASITRETESRMPFTLTYRAAYGDTRATAASFCAFFNACAADDIAQLRERRILATLSLSALRQRVNNLLDPSRGTVLTGEVTVSSKFLGSSDVQQFGRIVADAATYVPLTRSIVLAGHVRAGYIVAPRTELGGGSNFIPPEQRFYAGGPSDVRGYDRNELGPLVYVVPRDSIFPTASGDSFPEQAARPAATGGNRLLVANAELRLPSPIFSNRLRFAAFVDAGILGDGRSGGELRITPGVGMRFTSPLGPIRFDVGYNRYRLAAGTVYTTTPAGDLVVVRENFSKRSDRKWTLHFSVGQPF